MKIMAVDSSTASATCAIVDEGKLLGEVIYNDKKQHSVVLMNQIDLLLKNLNLSITDIDGFGVSLGPGSFTGLRIGMATIKGLSQGTNKPLKAISSLDALAYNLAYTEGIICPILDALRENVFTCLYKFENNKLVSLMDVSHYNIDELIDYINTNYTKKKITFIGDGVAKYKDTLSSKMNNISFAPIHLNTVRASSLAELALEELKNGNEDDLFTISPIYLRKSQAEREYAKKHGELNV
ncbi:tRNA (adenosine(37)-N6)-threonylcarbamoyltransferase complex dimerization subunit type 1 TsaB [Clostridium sp. DL1XJH146]